MTLGAAGCARLNQSKFLPSVKRPLHVRGDKSHESPSPSRGLPDGNGRDARSFFLKR